MPWNARAPKRYELRRKWIEAAEAFHRSPKGTEENDEKLAHSVCGPRLGT
jgi:hypothetical protein